MGIIQQQAIQSDSPDTHGAVGDGVHDDTAALQATFASGLNIQLTPGKTYLHRQVLTMNVNGVTFYGNGATLKRAAQGVTTTTTTITSGVTTSITVASTTGFAVGDQIVVEQGGNYDLSSRTINSIVGSVITVGLAFGVSLSGTTNVRTGWNQISINADDCRVTGAVLDGNSANWSWGRWNHTCGIAQYSSSSPSYSVHGRVLIDHNRIINQYGDGCSPSGYQCIFAYNDVENMQGRGISWSGNATLSDVGSKCIYNRFYNCDIDSNVSSSDGHGNIQVSSQTQDLIIHGNQIDTGINGIGSINTSDDSEVTITSNVIRNMTSAAIDGNCSSGVNHADNVLIADNRIYGSVQINMGNGGNAGNGGPSRWKIRNNIFVETTILLSSAYEVDISGNSFYSSGTSLTFITAGFGNANVIYGSICDNLFEGGAYCVDLGSTASNIVVNGNRCISQNTNAMRLSGCSNIVVAKNLIKSPGVYGINLGTNVSSGSNVLIEGNHITGGTTAGIAQNWSTASVTIRGNMIFNDATGASSYYGINFNAANLVEGNYIDRTAASGAHGIGLFSTVTGGRIVGNVVIGSGTNDCVIGGSITNAVVINNKLTGAVSDSGTNTQKSGNTVNGGPLSGRAVLVAGTVTVSNADVRTGDSILLTNVLAGGTIGTLSVGTITQGTSFVINSSSGSDTSTVYWKIEH